MLGASDEHGVRPGTENVASIVGLGTACAIVSGDLEQTAKRQFELRERLCERLSSAIPGLALVGHNPHRLPNTLNSRFPGVAGDLVLAGAPKPLLPRGRRVIRVTPEPSAVLLATGITPRQATDPARLTLGRDTRSEDVDRASVASAQSWNAAAKGR